MKKRTAHKRVHHAKKSSQKKFSVLKIHYFIIGSALLVFFLAGKMGINPGNVLGISDFLAQNFPGSSTVGGGQFFGPGSQQQQGNRSPSGPQSPQQPVQNQTNGQNMQQYQGTGQYGGQVRPSGGQTQQSTGQFSPNQGVGNQPPYPQGSTQQNQQQYQGRQTQQTQGEQNQFSPSQFQGNGNQFGGQNGQAGQQGQQLQIPSPAGQQGTNQGASGQKEQGQFGRSQNREQFEQEMKQEAEKQGIQFSGSLPNEFSQFQQKQNSQQSGQGQNQRPSTNSFSQALPSTDQFPSLKGSFTVQGQNGTSVNLNTQGTSVRLGVQNGNASLTAKTADGKETQISSDTLQAINTAMQVTTGAQVQQNGSSLSLSRGGVNAQTALPISFDASTKTFSVQTKSGEQEISVLPDQAVQKLIDNHVITSVGGSPTLGSSQSNVQLTERNNLAVFDIQGTSDKKLFGVIPVSISKESVVSAQTGVLITTNQSFLDTLLDNLSSK